VLALYRRHSADCKFAADRISKKCRCPLWATGTIEGKPYRRTLKTRSFERAEILKRQLEGGDIPAEKIKVSEAILRYKADCEARGLAPSSLIKVSAITKALCEFAERHRFQHLEDLGVTQIRQFRESWTSWGPTSQGKYIEQLRAFFRFCLQNKWLTESPAQFLKPPKARSAKVSVFTPDELTKIHKTIRRPNMLAFILVLQHTGLRISDATKLRKQDIKDGKLCIETKKTKSIVWLPLHPSVIAALEAIHTTEFYFWTGESKLSTAVGSRQRGVAKLLKRAKVSGSAHKFRHTLATNLLMKGTAPGIVAKILGNSEKVVTKYYDHWIPARQAQLEAEFQKTW
jgi:integrase